jgi:hypothetical protein
VPEVGNADSVWNRSPKIVEFNGRTVIWSTPVIIFGAGG